MIITGALTRCSDAAHLNSAGHMTSCSTLWVHEGPLLSSNQVTWYTLKHTEKVQLMSVLIETKTPSEHTQCNLSPHTNTLGHMKRLMFTQEHSYVQHRCSSQRSRGPAASRGHSTHQT